MTAEPQDLAPDEVAALLGRVELLQGLPQDELRGVAEIVAGIAVETGEVLFDEGEPGDCFYIVSQGSVEIVKNLPGGGEEKLAVRREGEAFGEMALLNDAPRSATARAVEDSRLLTLSRDDFHKLLGDDSLALRMLQFLSKALRALGVRFANLERTDTISMSSPGGSRGGSDGAAEDMNRALQRAILPRTAPTAEGYDIAAGTMLEDTGSGRTVWEAVRFTDGRVGLVALTAEAGGLAPAYQLAVARAFLNEFGRSGQSAETLFARVNDGLAHNEVRGVEPSVTAGMLVPQEGSVLWSSAGAIRGAVIRRDGTLEEFSSHGPPLGMLDGFRYGAQEIQIGTGEMVIVLSTGSTGLFRGAADLVSTLQQKPAGEVVSAVHRAMRKLQGPDVEETTVLFLRKH